MDAKELLDEFRTLLREVEHSAILRGNNRPERVVVAELGQVLWELTRAAREQEAKSGGAPTPATQ
jgi:hypothetical protein